MKIANTYREFLKIKRKFYKRNMIKRINHINGRRFVSYWEYKDWVAFIITGSNTLNNSINSYLRLMIGDEWYNKIKDDIEFLLNNIGSNISVTWRKIEKTVTGKFEGIVLTNMDAYYLIDGNLVSLYFSLEKK